VGHFSRLCVVDMVLDGRDLESLGNIN